MLHCLRNLKIIGGRKMIKMIAIDLDGTLLDDDKRYDKERFNKLIDKLTKKDVHIAIATGNQHVKAIEFFDGLKDELIFITDNGSTIHIEDELYYSKTLGAEEYQTFIKQLPDSLQDKMVISTHGSAIISDEPHPESFMEAANMHYPVQNRESDLTTIDFPIIKITLKFDEDEEVDVDQIESILPDSWRLTQSGFGFYDIVSDRISKLTAVKQLQELYDIKTDEIAAFGDSDNDFELLEAIPHSYAMADSTEKVKNAAKHIIGSNSENAVINTLEDIFK